MTASLPVWERSSACTDGTCVEVAMLEDAVLVRDSKSLAHTPLTYTHDEWRAFVAGVRGGQFDPPQATQSAL